MTGPTMRNVDGYGRDGRRRSAEWFDRRDLDGFLHRSWLKAVFTDEAFRGRPVIGISNCWSDCQLQRPPARPGRGGQARRAPGRRLPLEFPSSRSASR